MELLITQATTPTDDVRSLIAELEATLAAEYLPEQQHGLALDALFQPHIRLFVAYDDGEAVGCAGVALFAEFAEVKRMYVRPAQRGRGVADALLARIEAVTRDAGLTRLCLETGDRQLAAIRVYGRAGFVRCGPFGAYAAMTPTSIATSVFFEKHVSGSQATASSSRADCRRWGREAMTAIDHEAEYNNRLRIPEYRDIVARWAQTSAIDRPAARADLDQPYGPRDRQRYDLFHDDAGARDAPLVVFIHGGYWQLGRREDHAFVARALNAAGIAVAVPSYSLCPTVSVIQIIDELRRCLAALWAATGKHPVVIGHSAGGHLTAAMLATDWSAVPGVPADLVRAGCAISGVFELAPLIPTTMNRALQLDPEAAAVASPLFWPPPPAGRTLIAAVGSEETPEFHRQARAITERWAAAGVATEYLSIDGAHHFNIIDELTRPDSALFRRVVSLGRV
ncbi:MAG TPA: GNAT family N-acetyltransferase [Kofleriaceae bacterium]|nr:GNAT family N-acetyltransferase [Kofleriaceae bacterium]